MPLNLAEKIMARFKGETFVRRKVWDGHWQDIKELVRCDTTDFNRQNVPGYRRYDLVYDGTAINAAEELASGLHSYLTNPAERWFELGVEEPAKIADDPDALQWLEDCAEIMYQQYQRPEVNFNPSIHEAYLDLGSFGTCVISQEWDVNERHIIFKSFPLADCYFAENNRGLVDTMWRFFPWTGRQIVQEFGAENIPEKLMKEIDKSGGKGYDQIFKILHHVCPREDRVYGAVDKKNKPFASYWICENPCVMLREDGFDEFPYAASRWVKVSGETYGRGPAMKCLPDIKSLNTMEKVMLKAGQKAVDPPMVVPDDGFVLPIKTAPGSINYKEPGSDPIEFLEFKGNVEFGLEQTQQKRDYIQKCFYSEWLKMEKENKEMTATETLDRRDEKLRLMAPMLGRQQTELLGPSIQRTYSLLHSRGFFPPAPVSLQKKMLKVVYISPAARAQQGVKADRMSRFMQDLVPVTQIAPDVMDALDTDKMVTVYADARGVPRSVLRSPKQVAAIREQKQKAQAMAQAAQTAEPASKSVLNLAQAAKLGGGGAPGGPV